MRIVRPYDQLTPQDQARIERLLSVGHIYIEHFVEVRS